MAGDTMLFAARFSDGCMFKITGNRQQADWEVELGDGFRVSCPHGQTQTFSPKVEGAVV